MAKNKGKDGFGLTVCIACKKNPIASGGVWCEACVAKLHADMAALHVQLTGEQPTCWLCRSRKAVHKGLCDECGPQKPRRTSPKASPAPKARQRGAWHERGPIPQAVRELLLKAEGIDTSGDKEGLWRTACRLAAHRPLSNVKPMPDHVLEEIAYGNRTSAIYYSADLREPKAF